MSEKKLSDIIIHCHFNGEPSPELIDALNRMAEIAAKQFSKEIKNEKTVNEAPPILRCKQCDKVIKNDVDGYCAECWSKK